MIEIFSDSCSVFRKLLQFDVRDSTCAQGRKGDVNAKAFDKWNKELTWAFHPCPPRFILSRENVLCGNRRAVTKLEQTVRRNLLDVPMACETSR